MSHTLYYVHDPMCSWCWGFEPVRTEFFSEIGQLVQVRRLLGGLAPDSSEPMPESMKQSLQQTWQTIQKHVPGTRFNFDFWTQCKPRRSTYPACRAVLAARCQGQEYDPVITRKIQQAYYLQALNPSEDETLISLAGDAGLDAEQFATDLNSDATHQQLLAEINLARSMGGDSFPSLFLGVHGVVSRLPLDYLNARTMIDAVRHLLQS